MLCPIRQRGRKGSKVVAEPEGAEEHARGLGEAVKEDVEGSEGKTGGGADAADKGIIVGAEGVPAEGTSDGGVGNAEGG